MEHILKFATMLMECASVFQISPSHLVISVKMASMVIPQWEQNASLVSAPPLAPTVIAQLVSWTLMAFQHAMLVKLATVVGYVSSA